MKYKVKKYKYYKPGEEIQLEKVTTAEKVGNAILKALYFFIAVLFIFNLIRFIF